jgi:hypothetical protein
MGRTLEQLIADEKPEVVASAQAIATDILFKHILLSYGESTKNAGRNGAGVGYQATYRCGNGKARARFETLFSQALR